MAELICVYIWLFFLFIWGGGLGDCLKVYKYKSSSLRTSGLMTLEPTAVYSLPSVKQTVKFAVKIGEQLKVQKNIYIYKFNRLLLKCLQATVLQEWTVTCLKHWACGYVWKLLLNLIFKETVYSNKVEYFIILSRIFFFPFALQHCYFCYVPQNIFPAYECSVSFFFYFFTQCRDICCVLRDFCKSIFPCTRRSKNKQWYFHKDKRLNLQTFQHVILESTSDINFFKCF